MDHATRVVPEGCANGAFYSQVSIAHGGDARATVADASHRGRGAQHRARGFTRERVRDGQPRVVAIRHARRDSPAHSREAIRFGRLDRRGAQGGRAGLLHERRGSDGVSRRRRARWIGRKRYRRHV